MIVEEGGGEDGVREKEIVLCDACSDGAIDVVSDLLHQGISPNFYFFEVFHLHKQ